VTSGEPGWTVRELIWFGLRAVLILFITLSPIIIDGLHAWISNESARLPTKVAVLLTAGIAFALIVSRVIERSLQDRRAYRARQSVGEEVCFRLGSCFGGLGRICKIDRTANDVQKLLENLATCMKQVCIQETPTQAVTWSVNIGVVRRDDGTVMEVIARSEESRRFPGFYEPFDARFTPPYYAGKLHRQLKVLDREAVVLDIKEKGQPFFLPPGDGLRSKVVFALIDWETSKDEMCMVGYVSITTDRPHQFGAKLVKRLKSELFPYLCFIELMLKDHPNRWRPESDDNMAKAS
jgi:hypothetical protein